MGHHKVSKKGNSGGKSSRITVLGCGFKKVNPRMRVTFHNSCTGLFPSASAGLRTLHRSRPCGAGRNKSEVLSSDTREAQQETMKLAGLLVRKCNWEDLLEKVRRSKVESKGMAAL